MKVGDLVILTEEFKAKMNFGIVDKKVLDAWFTPRYFIIENVCKAALWSTSCNINQIAINARTVQYGKEVYYSIVEAEFEKYCALYFEALEYEIVG